MWSTPHALPVSENPGTERPEVAGLKPYSFFTPRKAFFHAPSRFFHVTFTALGRLRPRLAIYVATPHFCYDGLSEPLAQQMEITMQKQIPMNVADSGKVRLGGVAPSFPSTSVKDSGKVRLGGVAPSLPATSVRDSGKVRLGGVAPSLPSSVKDSGKVRLGGAAPGLPAVKDSGKVRLGGAAPNLPRTVADSGRVRLGGVAPSLPVTKDNGKVRLGGCSPAF
jgi:hypothetical protein